MKDNEREQILAWMGEGYNCSQVVLMHFANKKAIDLGMETAKKIAQPFELGHYTGETCGGLSGGLMVIGLMKGAMDDEGKVELIKASHKFVTGFKEKMGSNMCKDLLATNVNEGDNLSKAFEDGTIERVCPNAIFTAIELVEEICG